MIRRDRNHPSVILWSLGNEEPHQATPRGARINAELQEHVRRLDPTRPTTFAMDQGWDNGVGRVVDVLGFNYRTNQIEAYHQRHPEQPVIGTETGSTVATRGEYANDPARHIVRAYDTEHPWWATTAEEWWTIVADRPYIAGGFVWTGFDYRGEPTPFDTLPSISARSSESSIPADSQRTIIITIARGGGRIAHSCICCRTGIGRDAKDSRSRSGRTAIPRRSSSGSTGVRLAASRCLATDISNGASPMRRGGWRRSDTMAGARSLATFARRAVPHMRCDSRSTAGSRRPAKWSSRMPRCSMREGSPCQLRTISLRFSANGGEVIGVGNGNPNSLEPDVASERRAFNGLAQAIVRVGRGPVELTVGGEGLSGSRMRIVAL